MHAESPAGVLLPGALVFEVRAPRLWLQPPPRSRFRRLPQPSPCANRPPLHRSRSPLPIMLLQHGLWPSLGLLRAQTPAKEIDGGERG